MKQDLKGRFFEDGNEVAYVGFDDEIHIGKAVIWKENLVLQCENNVGFSKLNSKCLIIN
jgi:hypothetical protein